MWKKQILELGKKALENTVKNEQERQKQMDALRKYVERFGTSEPSELKWLLCALNQRVRNIGKKHKNREYQDIELHAFGWAYGVKHGKAELNYYTKDEDDALQNLLAYWYCDARNEEIFLKNVILYGEG